MEMIWIPRVPQNNGDESKPQNLLGDSCHMHVFSINSHKSLPQNGGFLSHGGTPFIIHPFDLIFGFSINHPFWGSPMTKPWWFPQVHPHVRESSPLPVTSPQHDGPGDRLRLSEAPRLVDVISSGVQGCQPRQPCCDWYTISRVEIVCYQEEIGYGVRKRQRAQESKGNWEIFARPTWI